MGSYKTQSIEKWERSLNLQLNGDVDPNKEVNESEFEKLIETQGVTGVMFDDRIKFLEDHGYPVTRETLVNVDLPARIAPASPESEQE